jgi:hypothetical protein
MTKIMTMTMESTWNGMEQSTWNPWTGFHRFHGLDSMESIWNKYLRVVTMNLQYISCMHKLNIVRHCIYKV